MLVDYIKTTFRNILRDTFYSALNITGLAIGLALAVFILLYVYDELTYDRHHHKHQRIYRIASQFSIDDKSDQVATSGSLMGPVLEMEYPGIIHFARVINAGESHFRHNGHEFYENGVFYADSSVFSIFTHPFVYGSPEYALTAPNTIVLTRATAEKYFGTTNPVGETIVRRGNQNFVVTGVIENVPQNSHLQFDMLISMPTIQGWLEQSASFWSFNCFTYILLDEENNIKKIKHDFPNIYQKYMASIGNELNATYTIIPQRLTDIHLKSSVEWDLSTGNMAYLLILTAIALFILLIAAINYMNLATARSSKRAKEVGVRKIVGASRPMLIARFLTESIIVVFVSLIIALAIVELTMPYFNDITGKSLNISILETPEIYFYLVLIMLFVGLISGSYPAFYLSSFRPLSIIKGKERQGRHGWRLRRVLVVSQFALSVVMIIGTITVSRQLNFLQNKTLGFNKEQIIVSILRDTSLIAHYNQFRAQLLEHPAIENVATASSRLPAERTSRNAHLVEVQGKMKRFALNFISVDERFIDLMGMELLEGRNFDPDRPADTSAFIINEAAMQLFGWEKGTASGRKMQFGLQQLPDSSSGKVIGVVRNFNYSSLHHQIEPIVFILSENMPVISIKYSSNDPRQIVQYVKKIRAEFGVNTPFNYSFLDDTLRDFYFAEMKLSRIFNYFAWFAIFISSLGLFGLSAFVAEQRTKEIGIRKTIGATTQNIIVLLTKDFLKLVLIGNILAWGIAYPVAQKWLQQFAYHIDINLFWFVLATIISLFIAALTVAYQAVKIALSNPIKSLRYE